jgi:hypothetical protein
MPGTHSAILGGSTAQRLLACPASYLEAQKSPINDVSSSYADEGTMLHEVVSWCVKHKKQAADYLVKHTDGTLTDEQADAVDDALFALTDLQQKYELDGFVHAFGGAVLEALSRDAHRERGEHCRFAPCKSTCKLWVGPVVDLSILLPTKPALQQSVDPRGNPYGKYLSQAMDLVEMAETWAVEIRRQAHVYLEDGGEVANWKLVPKRATRQWKEPKEVPALLRTAGALDEDIFTKPELKSVKQVEDSLKPKKIALPAELYQSISSGTTIAHSDDARPESTHGKVIENVRKALKALG